MEDEIKKGILIRLNKIIKITTEAKEEFEDAKDDDYTRLHTDMCTACAHMDHVLASIHAHEHENKRKEDKKKDKISKRYKKKDKRKKDKCN